MGTRQRHLIQRVSELAHEDDRVVAVLAYGSMTTGHGDDYSDVEFFVFFRDELWGKVDHEEWIRQVAPVDLFFMSDDGASVAIFDCLVTGEFHFLIESHIPGLRNQAYRIWYPDPDAGILLDRTGQLRSVIAEILESKSEWAPDADGAWFTITNFIYWMLFVGNRLARGERARALDTLSQTHRYLLSMARAVEGSSDQFRPHLRAEQALSRDAYNRFAETTSTVDEESLWRATAAAWRWGRELMTSLSEMHALPLPERLLDKLDRAFQPEVPDGTSRAELLSWPAELAR